MDSRYFSFLMSSLSLINQFCRSGIDHHWRKLLLQPYHFQFEKNIMATGVDYKTEFVDNSAD